MKYLLDTDSCVYFMNRSRPRLTERIISTPGQLLAISAVAYAELCAGGAKSLSRKKNQDRLDHLIAEIPVIAFDEEAGRAFGEIRASLEKRGEPIGPLDMLIAAHALSRKMTLITNNTSEFARVRGLRLENWSE